MKLCPCKQRPRQSQIRKYRQMRPVRMPKPIIKTIIPDKKGPIEAKREPVSFHRCAETLLNLLGCATPYEMQTFFRTYLALTTHWQTATLLELYRRELIKSDASQDHAELERVLQIQEVLERVRRYGIDGV